MTPNYGPFSDTQPMHSKLAMTQFSNLIDFIPLCVQRISKTVFNSLTQCFYLKATSFDPDADHH